MRVTRFLSALVFALLAPGVLAATHDHLNVDLLGRWASGPCLDVFVSGSAVYAGEGSIFRILDLGDPTAPVELGSLVLPGIIRAIAVQGNYAFVANHYDGLRIIDVTNPSAPVEVGVAPTGDSATGVDLDGDYACVAASGAGLRIIDVSTPAAPSEVGSIYVDFTWEVAVAGNLAFVGGFSNYLYAIDISNPASPTHISTASAYGIPRGIKTEGDLVYVCASGSQITQLTAIDFSVPNAPVELGRFSKLWFSSGGLEVRGDTVFLVVNEGETGTGRLFAVDAANPAAMVERGYIDTPGFNYGVVASAALAIVAGNHRGARVFDFSDLDAPAALGQFEMAGNALNVAVANDIAYLADREDGLHILDVSDPASPVEIGSLDTDGAPISIVARGNFAYICDGTNGLRIVDVSTPTAPFEVGSFDVSPGEVWHCELRGDLAYLATNSTGLRIVNVHDPAAPFQVGSIAPLYSTIGVDVRYPYAYLAVGATGLVVVDVSDPAAPQQIGLYDSSNARDVAIAADGVHAYLADGAGGVRTIDVSDPTGPIAIGQIANIEYAREVFVHNGFAYVAAEEDGLRVLDVSNPGAAFETGFYDTADHANGVISGGTRVFIADGAAGLWIFDNPPATPVSIALFDLEAGPGRVRLRWETSAPAAGAEFRLLRLRGGRDVELEWRQAGPGVFVSDDESAALREGGEFEYRLYGREAGEMWRFLRGESVEMDPVHIASRIEGAWPNPFNPRTSIRFRLAAAGPASLAIIAVDGAQVALLHEGPLPAGEHEIVWDGLDERGWNVGSGVYFVHLAAEGTSESLKLVLLR